MDTSTIKTCLLIVSIASLLFVTNATRSIHVVQRDRNHADLVNFCKGTTNPELCARTIQPFFRNSVLDPFRALDVEVEATRDITRKAISIISGLLVKKDTSKDLKDSLETCKSQYESILDSIRETKGAISKHDVITAKFKFSAVLSFQQSCKDAFDGTLIPFNEDSETVYQLGGNCLDIIAEMEKTSPKKVAPVQTTPSANSNVIGTVS